MALQDAAVVAAQNDSRLPGAGGRTELAPAAPAHDLHGALGQGREPHEVGLGQLSAGSIDGRDCRFTAGSIKRMGKNIQEVK